jgi:hypothetical protein
MQDGLGLFAGLLVALLVFGLYFIPALVASGRGHKNAAAIFVLNLLLGWMLIPWVLALVWALTDNVKRVSEEQ